MQRFYNLDKWQKIGEGEVITFTDTRPRTVRVEVNAPDDTGIFIFEGDSKDGQFLARVCGRDVLEFSPNDKFALVADGECYIYTADGQNWAMAPVDDMSFTRIVERKQRNPELERMMYEMQYNLEKRLAKQAEDFELKLARDRRLARRDADEQARAAEAARAGADAATADATSGEAAGTQAGPSGAQSPAVAAAKSGASDGGTK